MSDQNNNADPSNGSISGLSITGILPLCLSQSNEGLAGYDALRIDGAGRAVFVTVGYGKGKAITGGLIRTEAVLNRERLDRAKRYLDQIAAQWDDAAERLRVFVED